MTPEPYTLRDYQVACKEMLREEFRRGNRRALAVMPTGAGKTLTLSDMVGESDRRGKRVLWLVDREELAQQAGEAFARAGVPHSFIMAGHEPHQHGRAFVGTIQSYLARVADEKWVPGHIDLIVIDEAHRAEAGSFQRMLARYPRAYVVGLTATPMRGDGRGLGNTFDAQVTPVTVAELLSRGILVQPRYFIPSDLDFSRLKAGKGDFTREDYEQMAEENPQLVGNIVEHFVRTCPERRAVAFPMTIAQSVALRDTFNAAGISAVHIDGGMKKTQRRELMEGFRSGEYQVLTSVNIAIEGLDVPDVSAVIMARPTRSQRIWVQCLDSETEILTKTGWARIGEIQEGDLVYGFDRSTGAVRPVPALATFRRPLGDGERMVGVKGPHLDIRVTDGHRMVYKSRSKTSQHWQVKTAGDLLDRREPFHIPVAGVEEVDSAPLSSAALKFIGLFLSDGTLDGGTVTITQSLAQPQWLHDRIAEVLDATGFGYRKVVIQRTGAHAHYAPIVHYKVSKNKPKKGRAGTGWKAVEAFITRAKDLTPAYDSLSREQVLDLLEGLWLGDGTKFQGNGWVKRTQTITFGAHHATAQALQALCVRRGIRANLAIHDRKPSAWNLHPQPQAVLHYHPDKTRALVGTAAATNGSTPWQVLPHQSGEEVWCVENELGTLITRRNGKVAILGNCVGRGLRAYPGQTDCVVLDHAGAFRAFGPVEDFVPPALHARKGKRGGGGARSKKKANPAEMTCEACKEVFFGARVCPACGHEHETERAPKPVAYVDGLLEEVTPEGRKARAYDLDEKRRWWGELQGYVYAKGWKPGAAYRLYLEKFGEKPGPWDDVPQARPSPEVMAWMTSRMIAFRHRQRAADHHPNAAD